MANNLAFLQLDLADDEFRAEAVAFFAALRGHVSALLGQAIAAGELEGADAEALAETVLTAYNGALITWAVLREGPLEDWLRRRIDAVLAPFVAAAARLLRRVAAQRLHLRAEAGRPPSARAAARPRARRGRITRSNGSRATGTKSRPNARAAAITPRPASARPAATAAATAKWVGCSRS